MVCRSLWSTQIAHVVCYVDVLWFITNRGQSNLSTNWCRCYADFNYSAFIARLESGWRVWCKCYLFSRDGASFASRFLFWRVVHHVDWWSVSCSVITFNFTKNFFISRRAERMGVAYSLCDWRCVISLRFVHA